MTKQEKIAALPVAMTKSKRENGDEFYHFSIFAPEELKDIYLEQYDVRDIDYETFSRACDIMVDIYADFYNLGDGKDESAYVEEAVYERAADTASPYTADRLAYMHVFNEDDISEVMTSMGLKSIAEACAIWYDKQVEQAAIIIKEWINA